MADLTGSDSIAGLAAHVLATAPARFALIGLSMGGYVAFEILRRAPERVTRLALLDTQARADTDEAKARRRGLMELAEKGEFKGVTPRLLPLFVHPDALGDPQIVGHRPGHGREHRQGRLPAPADRHHAPPRQPPRPAGDRLPHPGPGRPRGPAHARRSSSSRWRRLIPDATLVLLPRCGHLAPLERPEPVTRQLLGWLDA